MKALLLVITLIFQQSAVSVQQPHPTKIKLAVTATCNDPVGELFVYHFREEIRSSSGYELDNAAAYTVFIVCVDASGENSNGLTSAISAVVLGVFEVDKYTYTWMQSHQVLAVGRDKTKLMASRLLAGIDQSMHQQ